MDLELILYCQNLRKAGAYCLVCFLHFLCALPLKNKSGLNGFADALLHGIYFEIQVPSEGHETSLHPIHEIPAQPAAVPVYFVREAFQNIFQDHPSRESSGQDFLRKKIKCSLNIKKLWWISQHVVEATLRANLLLALESLLDFRLSAGCHEPGK